MRIFLTLLLLLLTSCGKGGAGIIDSVLGFGTAPSLTSFSSQTVTQGAVLRLDVNNLQNSTQGDDKGMTYSCSFDGEVNGTVDGTQPCTSIPNSTVTFGSTDGVFVISPSSTALGTYEIKITGTGEGGTAQTIFTLGIRLKFDGIQSFANITGNSAQLNWTPNLQARGYQVKLLNENTGQYTVFKTINDGSVSGTNLTGLQPNHGYTVRVEALDDLGNADGNVVTKSFTTTELVRFDLSASSTTVPAGSSVTVTIHAKNANNTPQTVGGIPIVCSIASGSSTGTFTPVIDNNDGTYTTTFTANQVGTAITVGLATNLNFNIDTPLSLNVVPGAVSPLTSTLSLSQLVISSGNSALVTATLKDAFGNPVTSGISVAFINSTGAGESTGTFSATTNQGGGVYTADFTGVVAGTARTIGVSIDGVSLSGISQAITVLPGVPVSSKSTIAISTSTLSSGASATVTAVLKDINNNPVPSGLVVTFNKVGGTSTGDFAASVVNAGAGSYTTTYTGIVAGTAQTLSVSVGGVQLSPTTAVTVVPGAPAAAQSTLTLSSNSVNSGNFVTVTAVLKDSNLNPITSGAVSFGKTGGTSTGTLSAVVNNGGGNYSIRYTGVVAGTAQTLSVLLNGVAVAGLSDTIQVLPGSPISANSTLAISAGSISSGASAVITATLRDANNNLINSSASAVTFSKSGGTSTGAFDAVVSSAPGIYTTNYTGVLAGSSQSIGVMVDGSAMALSTNITVVPGSVSSSQSSFSLSLTTLPSGQSSVLTATLKDAAGNVIPSGITVSFAASGGTSTGTMGAVTNQGAGVYSANFTGVVVGTAKTVSVSVNGTALTALNQTLTVVPGAANSTNSSITISSATVASGSSVSVVATIRDVNNNIIPSGVSVSFNKLGGTSTGDFDSSVTNNGDGSYSTNYTGILAGTAQTISVSVNSANLTPTVSVTVVAGAPSLTYSSLTALAPIVSSGSSVVIIANLRDANLNPITSGTVSFSKTGGTSTGTFGSVSGSSGSYSVQYAGIKAGTAQTVGISLNGVAIGGLSASIAVVPGPASASKSTLTLSSSTVSSGMSINITASIMDDNSNLISSGITVGFTKTGGTSTGVLSVVSNGGSGIYTANYTGLASGTAQTIGLIVDGSSLGLTGSVAVVPGAPSASNSTFAVSSPMVVAGNSVSLTATVRDVNNNPISSGITVAFNATGGSSTGVLSSVVANGDGSYSGQFTGVISGTAKTLNVSINGSNFGATSSIQVLTGPPSITNSSISVSSATILSGNAAVVTATLKDSQNNPITSGTVAFTKTGGTSTGFFDGIVTSGNGVYTSNYSGVVSGTAQTIGVTIDGTSLGLTTSLTVIPGVPSALNSAFTVSSSTVVAGNSVALTATVRDMNNNPIPTGILVSFTAAGGTSTGTFSSVVSNGDGTYSGQFTGVGSGTAKALSVNINGSNFGTTNAVQVLTGPPSGLTSTISVAAGTVSSGNAAVVTATLKDSQNNAITSGTVSFTKTGGTSTGFFDGTVTSGSGVYTSNYTGVLAGTAQTLGVTVDGASVGISTFLSVIPGTPSAANSTISVSAASVPVSQAVTVTAVIKDINNNGVSSGITVAFAATGGTSTGTLGSITNLGSGSYRANYTGTAKGTAQTLQASVGGVAFGPTATITVTAGAPHHLALIASPSSLKNMACSGPYTLNLQDVVNVSTSQATDMTLTFASSGNVHDGVLYLDSSCSSVMSSTVTLPAFTETASFYYMSVQPQNFTLNVSSSQAGVASASFNIVTTPVLAWLGAGGSFTNSGSGSSIVGGDSDGGMVEPFDVYYDGTNTYVTDYNNSRIMRFDSNFNMTGWIGHIASTDGMTCQSGTPTVNSFTPSWCTGGRPLGTTSSLLYQVKYLTSDGTYLYATQGNTVLKFLMSNGTYAGFMGILSATNACGTSGTAVQWCTSIAASSGQATVASSSAIGGFTSTYGIKYARVSGIDYLYIADSGNHRIVRTKTDGSGYSWIGLVGATAPTTPAGCNGLTTGQTTTDWCTSGLSQSSIRYNLPGTPPTVPNEGFYTPYAVDVDTTNGYLYVGDYNNYRIARWNLAGTFSAWIGGIPTSSSSLATPTPVNNYTSGWTVGGSTTYSTASQGFGNIVKLRFDSNYIYFADLYHRVGRVDKATGLNEKWIGRVSTTPSGGVAGCAATASGSPTPGWCSGGGANKYGIGSGTYNEPRGLDLVGSKMIVADRYNYRLQQVDTTNGTFDRWIGMARNSTLTTWRKDVIGATRGGYDDSSLGISYPSIAMGITVDSLGNMFVSDQSWHRIKMFTKGSGSYSGYIGTFNNNNAYSPTGPDDCVGVTSGMTPNWCTGGGRTNSGNGVHGYSSPAALASDGTSLYIANVSNNRIDKVTISNGSYIGWIGKISTVPNDGPGCSTSAAGTITPNWCVGGTATTGTEYGALDGVRGLYLDGTTLYATDNRGRLYKISTSDGSTLGTVGSLSSGTGCTITSTAASGWCTASVGGGNSSSYGRINAGQAVTADTNYIYVVDVSHRILRFNKSTGAPSGFISSLSSGTNLSTTTGACNNSGWIAQGYPKVTPGWCYATSLGVALSHASSALDGGLNDPRGVWTDSAGYLYVLDTGNHRIEKYDAALGTFLGWKGRVMTTPTGGETGCTSLVSGDVTSGWCTGGSSGQSSKLGGFDTPTALYGDSFYLYVVDSRNNRVQAVPR